MKRHTTFQLSQSSQKKNNQDSFTDLVEHQSIGRKETTESALDKVKAPLCQSSIGQISRIAFDSFKTPNRLPMKLNHEKAKPIGASNQL